MSVTLTTSGDDVNAAEKKINQLYYDIAVTSDDQTVFPLPFSYAEGNDIVVFAFGLKFKKNVDFTAVGSTLTLLASVPRLYAGDAFEVYG